MNEDETFSDEPVQSNRWVTGIYNIADFAVNKWKASNETQDVFDPAVKVSGVNSTLRTEGKPEETRGKNNMLLYIGLIFGAFFLLMFLFKRI